MLITFLFLFAAGCLVGWLIEEPFWYITEHELVNRGFLTGPYLPIYGIGTIILFFISGLQIHIIPKLLLFGLSTTFIELMGGLFFEKYYHIRLWDYSKKFLNFRGHICPEYTVYWIILSSVFYKFVYPYLDILAQYLLNHLELMFFIGLFYGVFLVDLIATINLANKIKIFAAKQQERLIKRRDKFMVDFGIFRNEITNKLSKLKEGNHFQRFFFPLGNLKNVDLDELFTKLKNRFYKKP